MSNILTNNINPRSGNKITIGGVNDTVSIAGTLSYEDISNVDSVGIITCLLYTSPSPRDATLSRMPSSA